MTDTGHAREYDAIAEEYAKQARADRGGKRFCKWVRLAAKRHLNDLKRAKRKGSEFDWSPWHANDICDFIEKLPHVEGRWDTRTITLEPSQIFILAVIFGYRQRSDERIRRFSAVYIEMARKGAKSTLTAGVALYCLVCEDEPGPHVVIGATTGAQADKVFLPAKGMVDKTSALRDWFGVKAWSRAITCAESGGTIQPINAKSSTQDGWNPHVGILDELHAHKDRGLYDVIKSAFGARQNPLMWVITTAGYNTNGVCYEQRTFVSKVLGGSVEADHYFGIIFTLDEGDDPFDETKWIKANPMIGVTPTLRSMQTYAREAQDSPSSEGEFKTKRLNIWLNAHSAWLNVERWKACADPTLDWADFEGLDCWVGADLADKSDITAAVLAAIDTQARLIFKPMFWLPSDVLDSAEHAEGRGPAPYRTWRDQGWLHLTEGDWVDHNVIEDQLRDWSDRFSIRGILFDQFAAGQGMASRLNEDLSTPDNPLAKVLHKKASNVTDPARDLEARVKSGPSRMRHDGNPVMTWMAGNVCISRRRDGSMLPIKESQMSANKIDGIDALINALAPIAMPDQVGGPSVYNDRDILTV